MCGDNPTELGSLDLLGQFYLLFLPSFKEVTQSLRFFIPTSPSQRSQIWKGGGKESLYRKEIAFLKRRRRHQKCQSIWDQTSITSFHINLNHRKSFHQNVSDICILGDISLQKGQSVTGVRSRRETLSFETGGVTCGRGVMGKY